MSAPVLVLLAKAASLRKEPRLVRRKDGTHVQGYWVGQPQQAGLQQATLFPELLAAPPIPPPPPPPVGPSALAVVRPTLTVSDPAPNMGAEVAPVRHFTDISPNKVVAVLKGAGLPAAKTSRSQVRGYPNVDREGYKATGRKVADYAGADFKGVSVDFLTRPSFNQEQRDRANARQQEWRARARQALEAAGYAVSDQMNGGLYVTVKQPEPESEPEAAAAPAEPITPSNTPTLKWESRNRDEYTALVGHGTVTGRERYIVARDKARRHWYVVVPGDIDRAYTANSREQATAWAQQHWQHDYAITEPAAAAEPEAAPEAAPEPPDERFEVRATRSGELNLIARTSGDYRDAEALGLTREQAATAVSTHLKRLAYQASRAGGEDFLADLGLEGRAAVSARITPALVAEALQVAAQERASAAARAAARAAEAAAEAAAAPAPEPEPEPAPVVNRELRKLYPARQLPPLHTPTRLGGQAVVFVAYGRPFPIAEHHPSLHGAHLLGHEGTDGRYAYYREATPEEAARLAAPAAPQPATRDDHGTTVGTTSVRRHEEGEVSVTVTARHVSEEGARATVRTTFRVGDEPEAYTVQALYFQGNFMEGHVEDARGLYRANLTPTNDGVRVEAGGRYRNVKGAYDYVLSAAVEAVRLSQR